MIGVYIDMEKVEELIGQLKYTLSEVLTAIRLYFKDFLNAYLSPLHIFFYIKKDMRIMLFGLKQPHCEASYKSEVVPKACFPCLQIFSCLHKTRPGSLYDLAITIP